MRVKTDDKKSKEYDRMYKRPCRYYFPYSFIIYVLILIPVFIIFLDQARMDYLKNEHFLSILTDNFNAAQNYENQRLLIDDLMIAYTNIKLSIHHYSCLLLFLAIAVAYESILGYRTMAKSAQTYSWVGYASVLLALIIIFPNIIILGSHNQNIENRLIMSYAEGNKNSSSRQPVISRELFNNDLEELKKYSTTNLLLDIRNSDLAISLLILLFGNRIVKRYLQ